MVELERKFAMSLVWHNCYLYPPAEECNNNLYLTDGKSVWRAEYDTRDGWHINGTYEFLPSNSLRKYWWADISQTVQGEERFAF